MSDSPGLSVALHGRRIGVLWKMPNERSQFVFDQSYLDSDERDTLSQSFFNARGDINAASAPVKLRLPTFFANLLPEGALRAYVANQMKLHPDREYEMIRALGQDLPGAVTLSPIGDAPQDSSPATADLAYLKNAIKFSLAGVQMKVSAVLANNRLTLPAQQQDGDWIVKLASVQFPGVVENEFSMMRLAKSIGIDVPETRIVPLTDFKALPVAAPNRETGVFAVRRFDRTADGGRVHIEDFAQVFGVPPHQKYEKARYSTLAMVLHQLGDESGVEEFIRRMTFNVLIGNGDMHLKNFSLIYHDRKTATLAPAYDLVSTVGYIADEQLALKTARSRNFADFNAAELAHFAERAGLSTNWVLNIARQTTERFMSEWQENSDALPILDQSREAISEHLKRLDLSW